MFLLINIWNLAHGFPDWNRQNFSLIIGCVLKIIPMALKLFRFWKLPQVKGPWSGWVIKETIKIICVRAFIELNETKTTRHFYTYHLEHFLCCHLGSTCFCKFASAWREKKSKIYEAILLFFFSVYLKEWWILQNCFPLSVDLN